MEMNEKTVCVFQSKIGDGYLGWEHGDKFSEGNSGIINNCMQSVRDWTAFHNFTYELNTHDLGWDFRFNSKNDVHLNRLLQNWEHIPKTGYDFIIYLDNDVFVNDPGSVPPWVDFGMAPRYGDQVLFAKHYFGKDCLWFNSGVVIMSRERCNHLSQWILSRIRSLNWGGLFEDLPREESFIAEYCSTFEPTALDFCWNTMPPQTPTPLYDSVKLLHLLGTDKSRILKMCSAELQEKVRNYASIDSGPNNSDGRQTETLQYA